MKNLEPIDWITMRKAIAELAENQLHKKMLCEKNANSDDKILGAHKDYWLTLAVRHETMAAVYDIIWKIALKELENQP
jgi:hypothetical protein